MTASDAGLQWTRLADWAVTPEGNADYNFAASPGYDKVITDAQRRFFNPSLPLLSSCEAYLTDILWRDVYLSDDEM